ncbi:MAG: iron-containing redox enzyme family protein [Inquilinus sp.]|nr:iron-containing redox enzyme family protein [Inquilinus sp.]
MTVYDRIVEATRESRDAFSSLPLVRHILSEGMPRGAYLEFLEQLYHVVWHFCPTMAAAASRCGEDRRILRYALYHNIDDEKGHEDWVLNDIEAMDGDREAVRNSSAAVPIQAMIGFNYYAAEHLNPTSVLGMVHVLEEIAVSFAAPVVKLTTARIGMTGPKGFTFLTSHSEMDQDHVAQFKDLVQLIESRADQDAIINSAHVNYAMFGALFKAP